MDKELLIVLAFMLLLVLLLSIPAFIRLRYWWHRGSYYKGLSKRK